MLDRRDRIYAELGVPPDTEDPLERWQRLKPMSEPEARARKLDTPQLTLDDVDRRIGEWIAEERERTFQLLAHVIAGLQDEMAECAAKPGPQGERGPPGKLPLVKLWMPETVYYENEVVAFDGGTFQAKRDTGQPPSHADWICLATPGRDGKSITVRGTFDETADYRGLDVVARNGGSFVARKDAPGPCPGPGWQLLTSPGKRGPAGQSGEKGERGERGPRGEPGLSGATICGWTIDRARHLATPLMSDGAEGPPLELRELFEQFLLDAR
jgi:hypothetical protein